MIVSQYAIIKTLNLAHNERDKGISTIKRALNGAFSCILLSKNLHLCILNEIP